MAPRHKAPRRTASLVRRTALSAAAGSVLLTGATASVAPPASASAPRQAAPSPDRTHPPDTAVLRHHVYDLTLGTADHSAVGQGRLFAAYRALEAAGVHDWTVVGAEDPHRSRIVLRLWNTDAARARAARDATARHLRAALSPREVYSAALLAPVAAGSPAARGDVSALRREVARLFGGHAFVEPQTGTVYVHIETSRLTPGALAAVRDQAARATGSPVGSVRVLSEP